MRQANIFVFNAFVAVLVVVVQCPALALSDQEDTAEFYQTAGFVQGSIIKPAMDAQQSGDLDRALALRARAVKELTEKPHQSKVAQEMLNKILAENSAAECQIYEAQGKYDDAAKAYKSEWETRFPGYTSKCQGAMGVAGIYIQGKLYDKAISTIESFSTSADAADRYHARMQLSYIYTQAGSIKLAEKELLALMADKDVMQSVGMRRAVTGHLKQICLTEHRNAEAEKLELKLADRHCPKCGSDANVIRMVYGYPGIRAGNSSKPVEEVKQGGCVISDESARFWCKTDNMGF